MSYSFSVRAATKAEAREKVAQELAKVVESQPRHAEDQAAAQAAADAFIGLLRDDETQDICVSVNGYVNWGHQPGLTAASVTASVSLANKA